MKRILLIALVVMIGISVIWLVVGCQRRGDSTESPATQITPTAAAPAAVPATKTPTAVPPTKAPTAVPPTKAPPTSPPQPTANPIQNILWLWKSVTNQTTNETTTVPDPENYTISFYPDGTLEGKADCNTFTGTYSQVNGFSIKLGAMTQMACGDDSLDQQYLQLLGSVAAGGPDGQGNLALETAGGEQRMIFKNGGNAP